MDTSTISAVCNKQDKEYSTYPIRNTRNDKSPMQK